MVDIDKDGDNFQNANLRLEDFPDLRISLKLTESSNLIY